MGIYLARCRYTSRQPPLLKAGHPTPVDILLVDDHALFREGLALVLKQQLSSTDSAAQILEADSAKSAMESIQTYRDLDLVLLDLHLPDNQDFSLLEAIKQADPSVPVAMLSANEDSAKIQQALQKGASGFITKSSNSQVMISAIQLILSGGIYVPPAILKTDFSADPAYGTAKTIEDTTSEKSASNKTLSNKAAPDNTVSVQLTDRQKEVLLLMDDGLSNKEIAKVLSMSPSTVKVHVAAILRACNVNNRTQAVSFARTHHLL